MSQRFPAVSPTMEDVWCAPQKPVRSRLSPFRPPVPVGTRDVARRGSTSTRPDGRPEADGDETAWSPAQTMDPECRARGWRVAFHDCNERPIREECSEDAGH